MSGKVTYKQRDIVLTKFPSRIRLILKSGRYLSFRKTVIIANMLMLSPAPSPAILKNQNIAIP